MRSKAKEPDSHLSNGSDRLDSFQEFHLILLGKIYIPTHLEIHPETRGHVEEFRKAQGSAGSDTAATVNNIVDPLMGNMNCISKFTLG
jgi:hypothetical protein